MSGKVLSLCAVSAGLLNAVPGLAAEWKAPKNTDEKRNPVAMDEKNIQAGKKLYQRECMECHGAAGKGNGVKAGELKTHPGDLTKQIVGQTDGALYWKVTVGKQPMPSYIKLKEEQRWQLVNYMRTFTQAAKPTGPAGTTPSDEKTTAPK